MKPTSVLIVDDSALVRKMLSDMLSSEPSINVVGTANDPFMARDKIKQLNPDVLTLDVEMPKMDGLTFLKNLMRLRPMPVIMISTLTERGAEVTMNALELGAVDFVSKPKADLVHSLEEYSAEIVAKIKMAASARVRPLTDRTRAPLNYSANPVLPGKPLEKLKGKSMGKHYKTTDKIIAIGASTGGTEAIKDILITLPPDTPGIVITQHIPENFSRTFAERMDRLSALTVYEAKDGQQILPGHAYIAPGNQHLMVVKNGARYHCQLNDGPAVNRHRPSVDVLFRSVCQHVGLNAIGIILTGMGNDGAQGMKEMQEAGAPTIAQDENTSVVWGMPGEAVKAGGVDTVLPLERIADKALSLV